MSHTASFLWFLVLLILSSIQDKFLDDVFAFSPLGKHFLFFFDKLLLCWGSAELLTKGFDQGLAG